MLFKDISALRCSCDRPGAPGNGPWLCGTGWDLGVHGSTGYIGVTLVSAPGFFLQHHISQDSVCRAQPCHNTLRISPCGFEQIADYFSPHYSPDRGAG